MEKRIKRMQPSNFLKRRNCQRCGKLFPTYSKYAKICYKCAKQNSTEVLDIT